MTRYALQLLDDAALRYRLEADGAALGEIRHHAMHAEVLHVGAASYWLAHDEGAALRERGASWLRRFLELLRFDRGYSLRDAQATLATARRRWHWSIKRDRIDFEAGLLRLRVTSRGAFGGRFDLAGAHGSTGALRLVGLRARRVELEGLVLAPAQAALLMYAVQRCWGGQRHAE